MIRRKLTKPIMSLFIALVLIVSAIPTVQAATAGSYTVAQMKSAYPDGTFFTNNGKACSGTVYHGISSNCKFDHFKNGVQCAGFAFEMAYLATGEDCTKWKVSKNISDIKAGDVLWYNYSHFVYIINVSGNTVTFGEANINVPCMIMWGRTMQIDKSRNSVDGYNTFEIFRAPTSIKCKSHAMSAWTTTQNATCTRDGTRTRECNNCGYSESSAIVATGHNWGTPTVLNQPTYDYNGTKYVRCYNCIASEVQGIRRLIVAYAPGDVNGDAQINLQDALFILRHIVKLSSPISNNPDALKAACITDPNATQPQMADALAILRYVVWLPSPLD
ncbi:MAG: hypothetical protein FWG45_02895 [Oscillospiraceae bacterium]|nr:hypothetical protein [Oscillospiraceae bacterium]